MDTDKRILLDKKLKENKLKRKHTKIEKQRKQITHDTDAFGSKYRFANEAENERLNGFIRHLNFSAPAHILLKECSLSQHHSMYLCFLCGSEELLHIYLYGNYHDFLLDIDNFRMFSPYLLLVDEDLIHFIYINDDGEIKESKIE